MRARIGGSQPSWTLRSTPRCALAQVALYSGDRVGFDGLRAGGPPASAGRTGRRCICGS